ncbi:MAG TPA: DUF2726 domain-containing protein [Rhizobacter sp.]|nr:DUF2726 domain-containing protein [Rhizobacter sp.]
MQTLLIVGGLILLVALLWLWKRQQSPRGASSSQRGKSRSNDDGSDTLMHWHPQATRIMTTPERKAYAALRAGLPEHIILAQVPLARFLKVPTRHSYSEWLRRVGVLCADLVVCDSVSQVIAVVDIRAPESQENDRAKQRHSRMDRVLKAAEIPLHIWREDALPNSIGARNAILKMPVDAPSATAAAPTSPAGLQPTRPAQAATPRQPAAVATDDDGFEQRDPPSSTWFDELDSSSVPLAPTPMPPRGSGGPSIR